MATLRPVTSNNKLERRCDMLIILEELEECQLAAFVSLSDCDGLQTSIQRCPQFIGASNFVNYNVMFLVGG